MGHGACYFKAWDIRGEEPSLAKGTRFFEQTRISLMGGPSPAASLFAKRPHGN